jgi:hypothetical protein
MYSFSKREEQKLGTVSRKNSRLPSSFSRVMSLKEGQRVNEEEEKGPENVMKKTTSEKIFLPVVGEISV